MPGDNEKVVGKEGHIFEIKTVSGNVEPGKKILNADFETAAEATGFGTFNILLLVFALPSTLAAQFETTAMAYVYPAAQCDLNISLESRGLMNAVNYTGMIVSSFICGFIIDLFGRRKNLIFGYFAEIIFVLMACTSFNFNVLLVAKFFGGFIVNGPSTALPTYLSEMHAKRYRTRMPLVIGLFYSTGNIIMPLVAWGVLPLQFNLKIFGLELHSWNLYLFLTAVPALMCGFFYLLMPETPRYLMTKHQNAKAFGVFQKMYTMNTGKSKETYPVYNLVEERNTIGEGKRTFRDSWDQIAPVFKRPHRLNLILTCAVQFLILMSLNTLRLWLPQLFQTINDYEEFNNGSTDFCTMLNTLQPTPTSANTTCSVNFNNSSVYTNSMIMGLAQIMAYLSIAVIVNMFGKKMLLMGLSTLAGVSIMSVYYAPSTTVTLVLLAIFLGTISVCVDVLIILCIDLFPTSLRASALSLSFMCGRIGSVIGNVIFPFLLQAGCGAPFVTIGLMALGCTLFSAFLPNINIRALQ